MSVTNMPRISVAYEREQMDVHDFTSRRVPDEEWKYVDEEGHGHFWQEEQLPTLERVKTGTTWVGDEFDGDEIDVYEYRCKLCGEAVEPKLRLTSAGMREMLPGLAWYTVAIDGEEFRLTPDEFARSVERWRDALRGIMGQR